MLCYAFAATMASDILLSDIQVSMSNSWIVKGGTNTMPDNTDGDTLGGK